MANLQFGINLYPHQWRDAARIEELGYDSVWTSEHVFFYFPTFDALTTLAAVAALTSRIRLGTAVLLLPLRPAALAAKEITSLDVTSRGPPPLPAPPPLPPGPGAPSPPRRSPPWTSSPAAASRWASASAGSPRRSSRPSAFRSKSAAFAPTRRSRCCGGSGRGGKYT